MVKIKEFNQIINKLREVRGKKTYRRKLETRGECKWFDWMEGLYEETT
jgi:hypothetical protein